MGLTTVPIQVPPELFAHHPEGRPMVKSPQSPADAQVHDPRLRSEQEHRLNHQLVEYPRCLGVRIYIYIYIYICIFHTGQLITWMDCIVSLALARAALLGVGLRGGCSSLFLPSINDTVGFCPLNIFGRCSSFVDYLCDFHALKHLACLLVGPSSKIPSLYVGLFHPRVGDGMKENLVEIFRVHFLAALDLGKIGR